MGRYNERPSRSNHFRFSRLVTAKRLATAGSILGAIALASNTGIERAAFCVMLASSLGYAWIFRHTEKEIVILNLSFAVINVIGIWRTL